MPHRYLDIETTGLNPNRDEIITVQYQKIALDTGSPEEPLKILKQWNDPEGEKGIVGKILPLLTSTNPFQFVPVGNNLNFEFSFIAAKIQKYFGIDINPLYFHSRPHIDLKPVMILLNGGRFKGYHQILNKAGSGASVPKWYNSKEYDKIIDYVVDEADAFTSFYNKVHHLMFNKDLKDVVFNTRIDDFV